MISKRRKILTPSLQFASYAGLALQTIRDNHHLSTRDFHTLLGLHALQIETNQLIPISTIAARIGDHPKVAHKRLKTLLARGFVNVIKGEKPQLYNCTVSGEYIIRAYSIEMSRLINETPLSKWNRLKSRIFSNDKRRSLLREAANKKPGS